VEEYVLLFTVSIRSGITPIIHFLELWGYVTGKGGDKQLQHEALVAVTDAAVNETTGGGKHQIN